jgi:hypothetical protein
LASIIKIKYLLYDNLSNNLKINYYYSLAFSFLYLHIIKYAKGADIKIEEYEPAKTHIHIVNAKCFMIHVHRKNIAITTNNVAQTIPKDLLIVCRKLSSNIFPYTISLVHHFICKFSLILSNITIVSFILYHMVVSTAITNIVSI